MEQDIRWQAKKKFEGRCQGSVEGQDSGGGTHSMDYVLFHDI